MSNCALGTLLGGMQRHGLLGDFSSMLQQLQLLDQLVSFVLELSAIGVGIGALLDFRSLERHGRHSPRPRCNRLVDVGPSVEKNHCS